MRPAEAVPPEVLLLAGEVVVREALAGALQRNGTVPYACATVSQAAAACRQRKFRLALVDWVVGDLFADEIVLLLRRVTYPRPLPSVYVLSRLEEMDALQFLRPEANIAGVVTHPGRNGDGTVWEAQVKVLLQKTSAGKTLATC